MKNNHSKVIIEISQKSVFFIAFFILSLVFFQNVASTLIGLFVSVLIYAALNPIVSALEAKKIPRSLGAILVMLTLSSSLVVLVASIIGPLISQTISFVQQLPILIERLAPYNIDLATITPQIVQAPGNVLKIAVGTFSGVVTFFTLLVIAYYFLDDRPRLFNHLKFIFQDEDKAKLYLKIISEIEVRLGAWVRGMLTLMLIVGSMSFAGFTLIGLPSAIPLAVIAGLLELVTNIGPTIAAVPAVIVGFSISPTHGFATLGLTILIQQLENNFIVPKVMQKASGIHPVITIFSILIGYQLGGALLAVLSLPFVISVRVIIEHLRKHPNDKLVELES